MNGLGSMVRFRARLAGRVPATTVEAYLRSGGAAYDDLAAAETLRRDLAADGRDLWSLPAGQSSQLLATWCAFALQTLGEKLVECEHAANPRAAGYLPVMTAEQATAFLTAAGTWSERARRAAADPGYDIASEMRLPAPLPAWDTGESCPRTHVEAMLAATRALRERAQAALADFGATPVPAERHDAADRLHGLYAQADAAAGRAEQMWAPSQHQPLHLAVKTALRDTLDQLFRLGQILARPGLLDAAGESQGMRRAGPLPGEAGFDPWCLSDPAARRSLRHDPDALPALEHMWRSDPNPAATLALFEEVEQAAADGSVDRGAGRVSHYDCTPWPTIYTTRRPVTLAGHHLTPGQQFTLDICLGDSTGRAPEFHRDLLIATFTPTDRIGYCDQDM